MNDCWLGCIEDAGESLNQEMPTIPKTERKITIEHR